MEVKYMEKQQATGGSLIGFAVIILILFLIFPVFTYYLMWTVLIFMLIVGVASLFIKD